MAAASLRVLPVLVAAAVTLSACGQTSEDSSGDFQGQEKAVAQTIEDLQTASSKGDRDKICDEILAPDLVNRIKSASKQPCPDALKDALRDADAFELQVKKVTIDGTTATALVESDEAGDEKQTDTLTLTKAGDGWRISALGRASGA
jgi:hypothetical protein